MTRIHTPDETERALAILTDSDQFRLVIRGHALVEEVLDRGINAAFREGTPSELTGFHFALDSRLPRHSS